MRCGAEGSVGDARTNTGTRRRVGRDERIHILLGGSENTRRRNARRTPRSEGSSGILRMNVDNGSQLNLYGVRACRNIGSHFASVRSTAQHFNMPFACTWSGCRYLQVYDLQENAFPVTSTLTPLFQSRPHSSDSYCPHPPLPPPHAYFPGR